MVDDKRRDDEQKPVIVFRGGWAGIGQGVALALALAIVWIGWA